MLRCPSHSLNTILKPRAAAGFFDDFPGTTLNGVWTEVDPLEDGTIAVSGGALRLTVPSGTVHRNFGTDRSAVGTLIDVGDTDFVIEAKFNTTPSVEAQINGLFVDVSETDWLQMDTYFAGGGVFVLSATTVDNVTNNRSNDAITAGDSAYKRLTRVGDDWTVETSSDGESYTTRATFTHAVAVTRVGIYAGNAGGSPPAWTAVVDFFSLST